ncbi:N-acetyltransferase [Geobacillus sp. DSP4a]|nr:N-acetyltransferase [Geobacillus sp. DSP4a]
MTEMPYLCWAFLYTSTGVNSYVQSLRVLQKLGMQFEGVMREHWYIKGKFRDMAIYSILKRDYFKPVVLDKIRRA